MLAVIPGPTDELLLNLACCALSTRWSTSWLMLGVLMTLPYRVAGSKESSSAEDIAFSSPVSTRRVSRTKRGAHRVWPDPSKLLCPKFLSPSGAVCAPAKLGGRHTAVLHRHKKKCHFAVFLHKSTTGSTSTRVFVLYDISSLCHNFSRTFDPKMHHPAMNS